MQILSDKDVSCHVRVSAIGSSTAHAHTRAFTMQRDRWRDSVRQHAAMQTQLATARYPQAHPDSCEATAPTAPPTTHPNRACLLIFSNAANSRARWSSSRVVVCENLKPDTCTLGTSGEMQSFTSVSTASVSRAGPTVFSLRAPT